MKQRTIGHTSLLSNKAGGGAMKTILYKEFQGGIQYLFSFVQFLQTD